MIDLAALVQRNRLAAVEAIVPRLETRVDVTAGYLARDRPELTGFRHAGRRTTDEWAADRWERE